MGARHEGELPGLLLDAGAAADLQRAAGGQLPGEQRLCALEPPHGSARRGVGFWTGGESWGGMERRGWRGWKGWRVWRIVEDRRARQPGRAIHPIISVTNKRV